MIISLTRVWCCLVLYASESTVSLLSLPEFPKPRLDRTRISECYPGRGDSPVIEYNDFIPQPNPSLSSIDVVEACMRTIVKDSTLGLETCFTFSSDRCRAAIGGSIEEFMKYAENPVFQFLVNCSDDESWKILSVGPEIAGTQTRGAMQTVLMSASPSASKCIDVRAPLPIGYTPRATASSLKPKAETTSKRFLWTLQKERRPPLQGCWVVHEVMYVKNAYALTM